MTSLASASTTCLGSTVRSTYTRSRWPVRSTTRVLSEAFRETLWRYLQRVFGLDVTTETDDLR